MTYYPRNFDAVNNPDRTPYTNIAAIRSSGCSISKIDDHMSQALFCTQLNNADLGGISGLTISSGAGIFREQNVFHTSRGNSGSNDDSASIFFTVFAVDNSYIIGAAMPTTIKSVSYIGSMDRGSMTVKYDDPYFRRQHDDVIFLPNATSGTFTCDNAPITTAQAAIVVQAAHTTNARRANARQTSRRAAPTQTPTIDLLPLKLIIVIIGIGSHIDTHSYRLDCFDSNYFYCKNINLN